MKTKDWLLLVGCMIIPLAVGGVAGYVTGPEAGSDWFRSLNKPAFQPPDWVFGPVWTLLYVLMGVSLYLVVRAEGSVWRTRALVIFAVQLALNFLWSFIFFAWHQLAWASVEIVVLWLAIVAMIIAFWRARPAAAWLQLPYLAWVTFATALTVTIWQMNG